MNRYFRSNCILITCYLNEIPFVGQVIPNRNWLIDFLNFIVDFIQIESDTRHYLLRNWRKGHNLQPLLRFFQFCTDPLLEGLRRRNKWNLCELLEVTFSSWPILCANIDWLLLVLFRGLIENIYMCGLVHLKLFALLAPDRQGLREGWGNDPGTWNSPEVSDPNCLRFPFFFFFSRNDERIHWLFCRLT